MPRRNAIDVVSYAWQHMTGVLFRPMRWGIWWRVALLGFLSGEMHSNGGFNFQVPQIPAEHHKFAMLPQMPTPAVIALIAALAAAGLVLLVMFIYIGSVCRFILFEAVLTRRFALREGWRKWQPQGMRLFGFNLLMLFAGLLLIAIVLTPVLLFFFKYKREVGGHLLLLIGGGALLFTVAVAVLLLLSLVYTLVKDFVVPQMALENLTLGDGWRRLWMFMQAEKGSYAGYIGMKIVLTLGAALALAIVILVLVLILLIPGIIVGIVVVAMAKAHTLAAGIIALLIAAAICVAFLLICVISLLTAPMVIFFPAYSMHFFADRYPPLFALLYPPPPPPSPIGPDLAPAT
jgi:hypothetical protein